MPLPGPPGPAVLPGRARAAARLSRPAQPLTSLASTLGLCDLSAAKSFDEIVLALRGFLAANPPAPGGWVSGFGYDHNFLREKQHPTRQLLDLVSADIPILISNASGHMGVANSAALRAMGITADTPDPEGGPDRPRAGRPRTERLSGGDRLYLPGSRAPRPTMEQRVAQLCRAQEIYFSHGITTIQDGLTRDADWALLQTASDRAACRPTSSAISICSSAGAWHRTTPASSSITAVSSWAATRSFSTARRRGAPPG